VPPDAAKLLELYRGILRIRRFEERVYYLFLQGEIPGTLHQYQGRRQSRSASATSSSAPTGSPRRTGRTGTRSQRA
jgi:TPP-dependent pyruvate/acetoin dehydrogenase alpha subunit